MKCRQKLFLHLKRSFKAQLAAGAAQIWDVFSSVSSIYYLFVLSCLSALQTRQKHSQWRYADSAPFVETQAED